MIGSSLMSCGPPRGRGLQITLALGFVSGCQPSHADTPPFTTSPPETSGTASPDSSSSSGSSSSGGAGSTTEVSTGSSSGTVNSGGTTMIYDVGTDVDVGDSKPPGCKGKIDFLFVISRYGGMQFFQAQLLDAFPQFIDTIEAKFADFDYHIMVVDGDPFWGLSTCDELCPAQCVPNYPCGYSPTTCDATMGAGVVYPAGGDAANKMCGIDGNRRYMSTGQTNLKGTFACAAQLGSSGDDKIGEALTAAVHPTLNGPGGCNVGFLRDDALLMVTLISNTYDYDSKGIPGSWAASVFKAKHDDPQSIVMFSILDPGAPECEAPDRTCTMVKMFPYHLLVDRDEPDYGPFFEQATDLVEVACADFVPPG